MKKLFILLMLIGVVFTSCKKDDETTDPEVVGTMVSISAGLQPMYLTGEITFKYFNGTGYDTVTLTQENTSFVPRSVNIKDFDKTNLHKYISIVSHTGRCKGSYGMAWDIENYQTDEIGETFDFY